MVTSENRKMAAGLRKLPLLDVLYPCPIYTNGNIVLCLTRNRTGMTSNAAVLINDKAVAQYYEPSGIRLDSGV